MIMTQFELQSSSCFENQFIGSQQFWLHRNMPVGMFVCEFKKKYFQPVLFSQMDIPLPNGLLNAVPKRKAEFLAGRYSAKQLARALEISRVDSIEVKIGLHREPIWPLGLKGSITHNGSTAICLMSKSPQVCSLGIDIETIMSEDLARNISSQICNKQEVQLLLSQEIIKRKAITLIFSAKESIFKALYSKVGKYFDFDEAVLMDVNLSNSRMCYQLNRSFARKYSVPSLVEVDFMINDEVVVTAVTCTRQ